MIVHINTRVYGDRELYCDFASPQGLNQKPDVIQGKGFQCRMAHPDFFIEQIEWCDVMYLNGGETILLLEALHRIEGWREALKNKTICAYSAGVSALAKYSYNVDHYVLVKGTGVLPFNTIVHYTHAKQWMADILTRRFPEFPLLLIGDNDSITVRLP